MNDDNKKNVNKKDNSPLNKAKNKVVNEVGRTSATSAGEVVGRKVYDVASKTKLGQRVINNATNFNRMKNSAVGAGKIASNITKGSGLSNDNLEQQQADNLDQLNNRSNTSFKDRIDQLSNKKKKNDDLIAKITNINIKKIMILTVGVIAVGFIIILLLLFGESTDWNLMGDGISDYSEADYLPGYCTSITLVKEDDDYDLDPVNSIEEVNLLEKWDKDKDKDHTKEALRWSYRTIDIDEYVKHVLQAEAIYVDDEKTYEVAAIVARTYALQITSNSCYTFDNTNKRLNYRNPQKYSEEGSIDSSISSAVSKTAGIVLSIDDRLYDMSDSAYYDLFCYREKRVLNENDDENNYYRMLQENSEEVLNVDATWANENIPENCDTSTGSCYNRSGKLNEGIYTDDCQANGVSLFASKYLLNKEMDEYTTFRVIKYFLSYDIEFKKVTMNLSSGFAGTGCGVFDLTTTTLSRDEFISKVSAISCSEESCNTMKSYAGEIYDLAIANSFNPEVIYARAKVEGYNPGGSSYNYYGIGCSNSNPKCEHYSSVTEGATAFINKMKGYGVSNLYDVYYIKHYAYIGVSWISGSSTSGGCYYFPYIKKYYTNAQRVAEVEAACNSGNPIPTNDEDQAAYSSYQVQSMLDARLDYFGIGAEECNIPGPGGMCSTWAQGDPKWKSLPVGNGGTMHAIGCLTTAIAMGLSCHSVQTNIPSLDPGTFVTKMNSIGGYQSGGSLIWSKVCEIAPSLNYISNNKPVSEIDSYLGGNYLLVAHLNSRNHWVYVNGKASNGYNVKDPAGGVDKVMTASEFDRIALYSIGG